MTIKRRHTLTLDAEIVEFLTGNDAPLSTTVNQILADEVDRRRRRQGLRTWLDEMAREHGPVDEADVEHFTRLLS